MGSKPLRKVWRYVPELVEMKEVKAGDLFRLQKATPDDCCDEQELYCAINDATPLLHDKGGSTYAVNTARFVQDPTFGNSESDDSGAS